MLTLSWDHVQHNVKQMGSPAKFEVKGVKNQHNFDVWKKQSSPVFLDPCTAGIQPRTTVLFLNYQVQFSPLMKCFSSLITWIIPFVNSQSKCKILYFTSQFCLPSSLCCHSVFICVPQSAKGTLHLLYDFAAKAACCEGVCAGFLSISWIYSNKSKALYSNLSLLSANVCLRGKTMGKCVCACVRACGVQVFTFHWWLKGCLICND